jgi:hypothetical protein
MQWLLFTTAPCGFAAQPFRRRALRGQTIDGVRGAEQGKVELTSGAVIGVKRLLLTHQSLLPRRAMGSSNATGQSQAVSKLANVFL